MKQNFVTIQKRKYKLSAAAPEIVKEENDSSRLRIGELEPKFKNCYQLAFPNSLNSLHLPLPKISVAGVETATPFESQISSATFIKKQVFLM